MTAAAKTEATDSATTHTNNVGGDVRDSVQAGVVDTINFYGAHDKTELYARQVNEAELGEIRKQFLAPEGFERAERVLRTNKVVVLLGLGSGRTFAGLRLLDEQACARLVHLSPERSMGRVDAGDVHTGDGYLWDLSEQGRRPFKGWQFERMRQLVAGTANCRLVVVLGDIAQVPAEAHGLCVSLKPPSAAALAEAAIDREWFGGADADDPKRVLAELLPLDCSPEQALFAADIAMRVASGELNIDEARMEFEGGSGREVADIIDDSWQTIEYSLMFTVALLHNEPFDEVMDEARSLDDLVRRKQLRDGKKLRPRKAFVKPADHLLRTVGARTAMRDNPSHAGLTVETVQFARRGWAEAVLCRIWQHYHVDHDLLLEWMCGPRMSRRHFSASVWALCTLINQVSAGDRLRELHHLAIRGGFQNWRLAAATLARLEDEHGFQDLVQQALAEWVDGKTAFRKCAAVVFYGYRFDQSDPRVALAKIAEIAREHSPSIHNTTVATMLRLMTSPDRLGIVLRSVVNWADDWKSFCDKDELRSVALDTGIYLLRLTEPVRALKLDFDPAAIAERYPDECRRLASQIIDSRFYSIDVLTNLAELTDWHELFTADGTARKHGTELVRITRLLVPDLRWRRRQRAVLLLCLMYPGRRKQIRRIFRIARKAERSGLGVDVPAG